MRYDESVLHWIGNGEQASADGEYLEKRSPVTGEVIGRLARGRPEDARLCAEHAVRTLDEWSRTSIVHRGELLRNATLTMMERKEDIAAIVAMETGQAPSAALGEVGAAVEMGFFIAGEARRYYGRTSTSAVADRTAMTMRQPVGPAALITAANTPIANVAWKAFPALLCGNTAVLKASEDTPLTALWFGRLLAEVGVPPGVFSVLHGYGPEAGGPLVEDDRIQLVSFTGSVPTGRYIQRVAGGRLAKVCLELGGKNPFVVCDDADLESAAEFAVLSAFSNAGQRCASGSRIIVFDQVYDDFRDALVKKTESLRVGPTDDDDLGPVINETQLQNMIAAVEAAIATDEASVVCGGGRLEGPEHAGGYYMAPTIIEDATPEAGISRSELFGPITCMYRVGGFEEALRMANDTAFGLTAAIHTQSIHRAEQFRERSRTGVVSINGPTYGSEPHMPFGGLKQSGNGFREAGTEVLDVYSDWKTVYTRHDPASV